MSHLAAPVMLFLVALLMAMSSFCQAAECPDVSCNSLTDCIMASGQKLECTYGQCENGKCTKVSSSPGIPDHPKPDNKPSHEKEPNKILGLALGVVIAIAVIGCCLVFGIPGIIILAWLMGWCCFKKSSRQGGVRAQSVTSTTTT